MSEIKKSSNFIAIMTAATLALSANAQAGTGGASADLINRESPSNNGACPAPNRLKTVSPQCGSFLLRTLRKSVYDDVSDRHAVLTYQKLAPGNLDKDGSLGPLTAKSILRGRGLQIASPETRNKSVKLLIDKSDQVMYSLNSGKIKHVFSISSGSEKPYSDTGTDGQLQSGLADTPTGVFRISQKMGADYRAPLGAMPYAQFYDDAQGIAIHSGNVDNDGRDSHGCVRVDNPTMIRYIAFTIKLSDVVEVSK